MSDDNFLSRWSRLKKESRTEGKLPSAPEPEPAAAVAPPAPPAQDAGPAPLPPVESLTPESDFAGFMREEVDPLLRRQALKTLFGDPRFNVMDGLDVYIDDYSRPDPLPGAWLEKLNQTARLGAYRDPDEKRSEPEVAQSSGAAAASAGNIETEQRVDATDAEPQETAPDAPQEGNKSPPAA